MKIRHALAMTVLAAATTASLADTVTAAMDLSAGNAFFGRSNAVGSFVDNYTFSLTGNTMLTGSASSSASGLQDLDFTSLVIQNAITNATVATFAGNLGNDAIEFYSLASTLLTAGSYRLVVSGVNSTDAASYSGNVAISAAAVPEPSSIALMLAGLGMGVLVIRRRQAR